MEKTTFRISKMDCPSEEQLIRMKLDGTGPIQSLNFDIPNRLLTVYHSGDNGEIFRRLDSLNLGTSIVVTSSAENGDLFEDHASERKLLGQVLIINFSFFVLEMVTGFFSGSMGLVADSLDMLADSFVYGLALFAVGKLMTSKKKVARISGILQMVLAVSGFAEVIRRFIGFEEIPAFRTMILISVLALIGNAVCLYLLQKSRSKEAHMQASMIFTSNDVIANLGVILAGVLVFLTHSKYPDLVVGSAVFILVGIGAYRILQLSKNT